MASLSDINQTFKRINNQVLTDLNHKLDVFAQQSINAIAEHWANLIILTILTYNAYPQLKPSTIYNRQLRGIDIFESDIPLLESGKWITFIEFRITNVGNLYTLEVGVFDDNTIIGHSFTATPELLAYVNEYGYSNPALGIEIPERYLFFHTKATVSEMVADIVRMTWDDIADSIDNIGTVESGSLIGHIEDDGNEFRFVWN
jgi:hypothetical protein